MNTHKQAVEAIQNIANFINADQLQCLAELITDEEDQYFIDKMIDLEKLIRTMPKTYEQDGKGDEAIAYLHYFRGGYDCWITERDMEAEQLQAFGLVYMNGNEPELGYISIVELLENDIEIDLYWTPKTIGEIKGGIKCQ